MRAVIFDLAGTLIDSAPDIAASLNRVLAANGLAPLRMEEVLPMIGDGAKVLMERAFAARGEAATQERLAAFMADYAARPVVHTKPYEGIVPVLERLRDDARPLAVCTNKSSRAATEVLEILGLSRFFNAVVGGDATPYRKPDPRHLAAALSALEVTDAIMAGDHANDMKAAAGLRLPGVFCAWGYGEAEGEARAERPEELPEVIARLG